MNSIKSHSNPFTASQYKTITQKAKYIQYKKYLILKEDLMIFIPHFESIFNKNEELLRNINGENI